MTPGVTQQGCYWVYRQTTKTWDVRVYQMPEEAEIDHWER